MNLVTYSFNDKDMTFVERPDGGVESAGAVYSDTEIDQEKVLQDSMVFLTENAAYYTLNRSYRPIRETLLAEEEIVGFAYERLTDHRLVTFYQLHCYKTESLVWASSVLNAEAFSVDETNRQQKAFTKATKGGVVPEIPGLDLVGLLT